MEDGHNRNGKFQLCSTKGKQILWLKPLVQAKEQGSIINSLSQGIGHSKMSEYLTHIRRTLRPVKKSRGGRYDDVKTDVRKRTTNHKPEVYRTNCITVGFHLHVRFDSSQFFDIHF